MVAEMMQVSRAKPLGYTHLHLGEGKCIKETVLVCALAT